MRRRHHRREPGHVDRRRQLPEDGNPDRGRGRGQQGDAAAVTAATFRALRPPTSARTIGPMNSIAATLEVIRSHATPSTSTREERHGERRPELMEDRAADEVCVRRKGRDSGVDWRRCGGVADTGIFAT
jgi:hypothetical protein